MNKISTSLVVAASLVALAGCNKKKEEGTVGKPEDVPAVKPAEPTKPEVKPLVGPDLAEKYKLCVANVSAAKWDEFKANCVADTFTAHSFGGTPELKGPDALIASMKDMKVGFPDWKLEPQLIMVNGRNILSVVLSTGTNSGPMKTPMGESKPTTKKAGQLMFHRLKIDEQNKATDEWAVVDAGTMLGQLGMAQKEAPPTRPALDKGLDGAPMLVVAADDVKEKANLEAVKKGNEAFNARKVADMMATWTDDAVEMDQASPADVKGKKAIEKGATEFMNAFSDGKITNVEMWAAGDYVVQMAKFEGTNDRDMGKMKKTGKKVALDVVEVMHLKDGKIDQLWRFHNSLDFAAQAGLLKMPPPPAPAGAGAGSAATMSPAGSAAPAAGSAAPAAEPKK